jgi:NADH dehydrogenase FAD-containing subunit
VNGKGRVEVVKGSEFVEPFDMVIKALGQEPQQAMLKKLFPKLKVAGDGTVVRDGMTGQTSLKHVFAGGDCANGGREVVNAVAEGKKAARGIHKFLAGRDGDRPGAGHAAGRADGQAGRFRLRPARAGSGTGSGVLREEEVVLLSESKSELGIDSDAD